MNLNLKLIKKIVKKHLKETLEIVGILILIGMISYQKGIFSGFKKNAVNFKFSAKNKRVKKHIERI